MATKNFVSPDTIRTVNSIPDRSADVLFDEELEPSKTQQQFAKECDINYIVKQAEASGFVSHTASGAPTFGDFSDFGDATYFQSAKNYLIEAQASFDALPANVRARFANDPARLLDFVQDPDNLQEAIKLGLAEAKPEPTIPEPKPSKKAPQAAPEPSLDE